MTSQGQITNKDVEVGVPMNGIELMARNRADKLKMHEQFLWMIESLLQAAIIDQAAFDRLSVDSLHLDNFGKRTHRLPFGTLVFVRTPHESSVAIQFPLYQGDVTTSVKFDGFHFWMGYTPHSEHKDVRVPFLEALHEVPPDTGVSPSASSSQQVKREVAQRRFRGAVSLLVKCKAAIMPLFEPILDPSAPPADPPPVP